MVRQLADLVPHHVLSTDVPIAVHGRAVICERLAMFPVECVARGYLTGSGLLDYRATGARPGVRGRAARGPRGRSRLPEPIFTPATKAAVGDHDENVSYDAVERRSARNGHPAARADPRSTPGPRTSPPTAASSWPTPSSNSAPAPTHWAGRRGADPGFLTILAG